MLALRNRPFSTIASLRNEMDRLFDGFITPTNAVGLAETGADGAFAPTLNVWEDETALHVEAEMPGFKQDELDISVDGDRLTIRGERSRESEEQNKQFHHRERWVGRFSRSITLPTPINTANVSASLTDGVLSLTLPKREDARPRKITVTAGK